MRFMKTLKAWLQAARLPSQSYIFIPLLLGQAIYFSIHHTLDWISFFIIQTFGIFNQLYIVFANDFADLEGDRLNQTYTIFSGGSRVLADGKLKPEQIRNAAILMAIFCFLISIALSIRSGNLFIILLSIFALLLLQMYSYPPLRLSYNGGGEFLQMLGVGIVLPIYGFLGQSGTYGDFKFALLLPLLGINLACAMATSLPDKPSDALIGKKTMAVTWGLGFSKCAIILLELAVLFGFAFLQTDLHFRIDALLWILPFLMICFSLLGIKALPGEFLLSVFVFFSIAFNLSIQVILIVNYFFYQYPA